MRRTAVFLTEKQFEDLESIYRATGCRASESIRRAIDSYLEEQKEAVRAGRKMPER
jgi:metal-responsive CopG/Arc/MetJ family transcriptional regulator